MHLRTAAIQLNPRNHLDENMIAAEQLLERAGTMGAQCAVLPELWTYRGPYNGYDAAAQSLTGPAITMLQDKARKYNMIVNSGSIIERHPRLHNKFYNTSVLINPKGEIAATYRKIHLFDVDLANGDLHTESQCIEAGDQIVTTIVEGVTFGLAICYDLRFPELFRALKLRGAQIMLLPAAFTLHTGRDHWEVLVRARAIENQCYLVAAGQVGTYLPGKENFGRSMIVDPWGLVLAQAQDMPTVIMADLDLEQITHAQKQIPCMQHRAPQVYHL